MIIIYFLANRLAKLPSFSKFVDDTINPIEGSLLGLLALLLAFTFGMSASRYETRRAVMLSEANNIGTVILRCDLYPDSTRNKLRTYLKEYVEARIAYFQAGTDDTKETNAIQATEKWDGKIWSTVAEASKVKDNLVASNQMVPALNAMIDIVTTRNAEKNATVPDSILWLLFLLCIISSFILGFQKSTSRNPYIISIVFALMVCACIQVIIDLDRPRQGFINMQGTNQYIVDLRKLF
jgi:flagellar biosynthesis regulator FlaF